MGSVVRQSWYEDKKRRNWNTFLNYLKNHEPPLTLGGCSGAEVVEYLKYLHQFGKTKVHISGCCYFGDENSLGLCVCPLEQAWGSLDARVRWLREAYQENRGGQVDLNPFGARDVGDYLKEVRERQQNARGISYERKKKLKQKPVMPMAVPATQGTDGSGGGSRGCCGATDAPTSTEFGRKSPQSSCRRPNLRVTVCQKCGDYGFYEALIFCVKCQVIAEHLYCSDELPETFNEHVGWACEFCVPRAAKQTTLDRHSPTLFRKSDQICLRSVPTAHSGITLKKLNNITNSNANTEVRGRESSPSLQPRDVHSQIDMSKSALLIGDCSSLVENISSCYENHGEDQESRKKRRLVCDDGGKFDEGVDDVEDVEYVKVKSSQVAAGEPSNIVENNLYVHAQPIFDPIWRGSFNTCNGYFGATDGLAAHLSSKACLKVFEVASLLPAVIHLEMLPKPDVWPKFFDQFKPTDDNIALYFFQENERDEKDFDILVNNMISQDLAMKAVVENIELLIFTSLELPMEYWRFQGKHYLWGLFKGSKASPLNRLKDHHFIQKSSINVGTREERNLTKIWDIQFSPHPLSNNGKKEKKRIKRMKPKIERKALTLRKCHFIQSLRPCCKRIRSKANRMNPFLFNKKVVSGNTPRTGALMQEQTDVFTLAQKAVEEQLPKGNTANEELTHKEACRTIADGLADTGVIIDSIHHEDYAKERSVDMKMGPEGITEKETEAEIPSDTDVIAGTSQDKMPVANGGIIRNSVAVAILPQEITHTIDGTFMNKEIDQFVLKARSKHMPEGSKQLVGTSKGPFNAGTSQDELSVANGVTIWTSGAASLPQEVTHAIVETSMNEDQLVRNAQSKHIPEGLEQWAGTSKGPFNAGISQDELSVANGVTIWTSVDAVLPQEVTHPIVERSMNKEVDQLVLNAWSKHMPEALEQPAGASKGPFKAGTSQDELSAANGVTIRTSVAAVLPQEVTHEIEETSMNEEVDQLALKSPSNLEQPAGTSKGPFKAGTNQELSASNGFTVMASVATVLPQEVTHAIVETSMNEEVDQLVLNAPSKHILEGLAQPAGTNKGPFKAGTSQDELPAANGVTIRTSVAAVLLEEVTHEIVETSMNEGTSRGPVNAGNNQDELLAGNGDAIRNTLVVILPQKITQAAVETSMNEDKVPSKSMPEGLEQPIGTGEGPQAVPIKSTPEATVPSAIPSAISKFMASAPDVQSTTATQSQEVPLHTMLEGNQEGEGTSSPEQLDSQSIYPSILNTVSICDELMKSDETVPLDNSLAQVGPYFVKSRLAPILQAVIDKHGDIAQDCIFEMNSMRSCVLERICEVIQELQGIPFRHLKGHHLASLYSIVQYAEPEKMKVEWLRCRHNELKEAARSIHQYESTKKALSSSIEVANSLKRTLDLKKADMMKLQSEFQSLENQLTSLEAEAATLDCSTSKYEWFHKSLVDGLL